MLKNLSITELKYKLMAKGLNKNLIEDYFYENKEELTEYEIKSATKILNKKKDLVEDDEIRLFLLKKGYREESIKQAFNNID